MLEIKIPRTRTFVGTWRVVHPNDRWDIESKSDPFGKEFKSHKGHFFNRNLKKNYREKNTEKKKENIIRNCPEVIVGTMPDARLKDSTLEKSDKVGTWKIKEDGTLEVGAQGVGTQGVGTQGVVHKQLVHKESVHQRNVSTQNVLSLERRVKWKI